MTIRTRLFGKTVNKVTVGKLLMSLGEDWNRIINGKHEKYSITDLYGKCRLIPSEKGIDVDIYVLKTVSHEVDGTYYEDYVSKRLGEGPLINERLIEHTSVRHFNGKINYERKLE